MTVYAFGLTYSNIAAELPHMTFSGSSKPTTSQITAWITSYCAEVVVQLESLGVCTNATASSTFTSSANEAAYEAIRLGITQVVTARVALANQEQDTTLAAAHRADWQGFLERLRTFPFSKLGDAMPSQVSTNFSETNYRSPTWSTAGNSFR